jgi:hypothetical protein
VPRSRSGIATSTARCSGVNILILLFTVNAYPFAAFMLFIVDVLVIYGLIVYGGPLPPPSRYGRGTDDRGQL